MIFALSILVGVILNRYFNTTQCVLQIGEIEYLFAIEDFPMYVFTTDTNSSLTNVDYTPTQRCQGFAIASTKTSQLIENLELYMQRKTEVRYNTRKYIIFLPDGDMDWMDSSSALHHVADAVIIKYLENRHFEIYTHAYVGIDDNNAPVLLDVWFPGNESFLYNNDLFPEKLQNQFGRTLNVITADYIPYSHIESKTGTELMAILEYAVKFNVTLNITTTELWGKIYANWTGTGILGSVVMGLFDVGFSALFAQPCRILYSDFSKPTTFSQVSCVVPAPQMEDGWFVQIKGFNLPMWTLLISSYSCLGITVYIAKSLWCSRKTNTTYFTFVTFIGLFISQPIPTTQIPKTSGLRYVLVLVLIMTVMTSTIYSSRLSSILVAPAYVNEIKTVEQLAKSKLLWGELQDDWVIPLEIDDRPLYKIIKKKFRVETAESLRKRSLKNNFAFGTERLSSGYYAIGDYFKDDVVGQYQVMSEDLYRQYTGMQLRKSSILLPSIDSFLLRVTEAGLVNYWEGEASREHSDYKVQTGLKIKTREGILVRLQFGHVKGVFLLWGIGLFIALLKFLHEIEKGGFVKRKLWKHEKPKAIVKRRQKVPAMKYDVHHRSK